jgi:DeoR family suf operon transcriptional repressor
MEAVKHRGVDGTMYLQHGPASEILRLLQRHGPLSVKQLRAKLGVRSLNAVREQLANLTAAGLVTTTAVRHGTGRPAHMYALSHKAQALFPKGYDLLLKLLLDELFDREGSEQVQEILAGVSARLVEHYGGRAEGQGLAQRLAMLAQAYDEHSTPIAVVERDSATELYKYSCPYFEVAQENAAVCAIEQHMMEQVLGQKVHLLKRMIEGHAGCQFVIERSSMPQPGRTATVDDAAGSMEPVPH